MRHVHALAAAIILAAPLGAQAPKTVSPGMTKAQVVTALGEPATLRTVGEDTYMFYLNKCGKKCGMNDLVVLHADTVVDAIFRAPDRKYTGKSSSPVAIPRSVAAKQKPSAAGAPLKMKPGPPNDTRPSIPVKPPIVPADSKSASKTRPIDP
jgi:hypothetical protein